MFQQMGFMRGMLVAAALGAAPALAADQTTNVNPADRYPRPSTREGSARDRIGENDLMGGWRTFLGDLHAHSRGHGEGSWPFKETPIIHRSEVAQSAWLFGYDFISISNHSTSWEDYDDDAPPGAETVGRDAEGQPDLVIIKGMESHLGPDANGEGPTHDHHFNTFNRWISLNTDNMAPWHDAIVEKYSSDPLQSVHVQLNHPDSTDPWFTLPTDPSRRAIVRDAIALVEYNGLSTYFNLLRRGFRVAPVSNSDAHANFRHLMKPEWQQKNPDGSWVRPYLDEPGVPREKIFAGDDVAQGRGGIVLPPTMTFSYDNFLRALRNRWAFRTALPGASGFFLVNQRPMGSEFQRASNERRLDFTVWGTTKNGSGGGGNEWTKLEVWSPFQPGQPIKEFTYDDPGLVDLKQTFSLTPYESVYVIRLQQNWFGADVILAPIWITNPLPKPSIHIDYPSVPRSFGSGLLLHGGGERLLLQRATRSVEPRQWQTVTVIENTTGYYPLVGDHLPKSSQWRVVDPLQQEVISNEVQLTLTDALDVTIPPYDGQAHEGRYIPIRWSSPVPVRAAYYASRDNGATWTWVGEESTEHTDRLWYFHSAGWGNANVMVKVVSVGANLTGQHGATIPFYIAAGIQGTLAPYSWPISEGSVLKFNWTSATAKRVAYHLSRDNGATWSVVATEPDAKAQGEFWWDTTGWATQQGRLRIVDTDNGYNFWQSELLAIMEAPLRMTAQPSGGPFREGQQLQWSWDSATAKQVSASVSLNNGATWTVLQTESTQKRSGTFVWNTAGSSCTQCLVRFQDVASPSNRVVSTVFRLQKRLSGRAFNASINPQGAPVATDGNMGSAWPSGNGNQQWIDVDLGAEYTFNTLDVYFGEWNPPGWYMATSLNGTSWGMNDSGSLQYAPNQLLTRNYEGRGGLRARYVRFYISGTFPGVTTSSFIREIHLFQ